MCKTNCLFEKFQNNVNAIYTVRHIGNNALRAAPCKYRLGPCKIEESDVLKLFLGIALGPPITEIPILIGWGKYFFSYLTLLFWHVPAGKINWKSGFLQGLVRTNATLDQNTNYFIHLLGYRCIFYKVLE